MDNIPLWLPYIDNLSVPHSQLKLKTANSQQDTLSSNYSPYVDHIIMAKPNKPFFSTLTWQGHLSHGQVQRDYHLNNNVGYCSCKLLKILMHKWGIFWNISVRDFQLVIKSVLVGVQRSSVGVQRSSVVSTLDCWCPVSGSILARWLLIPVLGSILTQSPLPPRAAQEQELPLKEVGPSPGWQPGWLLYYKICIKSGKKYKGKKLFMKQKICSSSL